MALALRRAGWRRWHWIAIAVVIAALDYFTGTAIQFPVLTLLPIGLATWIDGRNWGIGLAVMFSLMRVGFTLAGEYPGPLVLGVVNAVVDAAVLVPLPILVDHLLKQRRTIRVLAGMLPICGFCKRIRTEHGNWVQLERYITDHSEATFSHTFCPECGATHYGFRGE